MDELYDHHYDDLGKDNLSVISAAFQVPLLVVDETIPLLELRVLREYLQQPSSQISLLLRETLLIAIDNVAM
jgi:hypothetical protein